MNKAAACLAAVAVAGCQRPTGHENFDRLFVWNYREIVEFWRLSARASRGVSPPCDETKINSMVPDPYPRLGRDRRLTAQTKEIEKMSVRMLDAGKTPPKARPHGAIIDCFGSKPQNLSDQEMAAVIDRRLDEQMRIIKKMRAVSAKVLGGS